ncbi:MAG: Fic family protein [Anaerolineales bacterium]
MDPKNFSANIPGRVIRSPKGYFVFVPNPLPPNLEWTGNLVSALSAADRNLAALAKVGASFPVPQALIQPIIRKEAVLSSRIEGTRATYQELVAFEIGQLPLFESADAREVHNYVRALTHGVKRLSNLPVSLRLIREMHSVLLEGVRGSAFTPGEFRRSQNWIGAPGSTLETARFVPPPADEMLEGLNDLEHFIHAKSDLPPLVRIGLAHYQFEAIHPFLDGNGRIGRLLISLLLIAWELLPQPLLSLSEYIETNRQEYYDRLLAVSQQNEWEKWLLFFLRGVETQAQDTVQRVGRLAKLRTEYIEALREERTKEKLTKVIDYLIETPITSISNLQKQLKLSSFVTAQRYVERLVEKGVLKEVTGKGRNRLYQASGIIKALGLRV